MTSPCAEDAALKCGNLDDIGADDNDLSVRVRRRQVGESRTSRPARTGTQQYVSVRASDAPGPPIAESLFAEVRPRLFGIAYRVLGGGGEAEDIVQEAWIRWQNCDRSRVRDASAFLATATARLSSNAVQSARARRETYMGPGQQDPVDASATPEVAAERAEALEFALRLTLEKLSPSERAAYVLRHAFDYPYERIAEIIQQTQGSVRQHVSRARKRLTSGKRAAISSGKHQQLLDAFVAGAHNGNLTKLERLFAADVIDGGSTRGRAQIDASQTRNASRRSLAAPAPSWGSQDRHARSQPKAVASKGPDKPTLHSSTSKLVTFAPGAHGPGR
jgi:RNA polymerase sigma factor (sigma-70 family)